MSRTQKGRLHHRTDIIGHEYDDHRQYAHLDGRRPFTAPIGGVPPEDENDLVTLGSVTESITIITDDLEGQIEEIYTFIGNEIADCKTYVDGKIDEVTIYIDGQISETRTYIDEQIVEVKTYIDNEIVEVNTFITEQIEEVTNYIDTEIANIDIDPLPTPIQPGQVLFAKTDTEFTVETPLTSSAGWLVNDQGVLLIV